MNFKNGEYIRELDTGSMLILTVKPSSRNRRLCFDSNQIRIDVKNKPEKGKANRELLHFLAEILDVPQSTLVIKYGGTSREKQIRVSSLSAHDIRNRLQKWLRASHDNDK